MTGTLYLVGTGPGDPELITLKAARILGEVGVVAYPQKEGEPSLSYRIAEAQLSAKAERLPVSIPMAVERGPAQNAYDSIALEIAGKLDEGCDVAYLCEGDPLFYGSAMYLIERIAERARIEVVPGVTSLTAAAAVVGRPLAARNEVLKVIPAPLDDDELRGQLEGTEAAAIIKVGRHFDRVRALLDATGHAEGAIVVEHATGEEQRITPLRDFAFDARPYFSTILCYAGTEAWAR